MTTASFSPNKTQFYTANGFGRDSYIHGNNGGFVPQKKAVQCEALGSFVVQKKRPAEPHAHIHSKPVVYTNNGGGRDTYISGNAGGFRPMHRDGFGKETFYNGLRQYGITQPPMDKAGSQLFGTRKRSTVNSSSVHQSGSKADVFQNSQEHFSPGYRKQTNLVHNYQLMMDHRLSKPKTVSEVEETQRTSQARIRIFKNSSPEQQLPFQKQVFGKNQLSPSRNEGYVLNQQDSFDRLNGPYANQQ